MLASAIAAEAGLPTPVTGPVAPAVRWWWRPVTLATAALALVFAVVAVTGLLRPQPVTALGDLARVAEQTTPPAARGGELVYSRTQERALVVVSGEDLGLADRESAAFLSPIVRERWAAPDGQIREVVSVGEPEFFDEEAEAAYRTGDLAIFDGVGEVFVSDFTAETTDLEARNWPTEPAALVAAMQAYVSGQGSGITQDAAVVELAADLLRVSTATPELRGAVLRALDRAGVDVAERAGAEGVIVRVQYVDQVQTLLELEFDADANLVLERVTWLEAFPLAGTPAGVILQESVYTPARVVDSYDGP